MLLAKQGHIEMPKIREKKVLEDWRAQRFVDWIISTGRKIGWVAKELGYSKVWISYVVNGREPMSDQLAVKIEQTFNIALGMGYVKSHNHRAK